MKNLDKALLFDRVGRLASQTLFKKNRLCIGALSVILISSLCTTSIFHNPLQQVTNAQTAQSSTQTAKLLLEDAIQSLEGGDTNKALVRIKVVDQQLSAFARNSSSIETAKFLLEDAIGAINNRDMNQAISHLNLADQQLPSSPVSSSAIQGNTNQTQSAPTVVSSNNLTHNRTNTLQNTTTNLTILRGASIEGNPAFHPNPLILKAGSRINVTNEDSVPHTVTNGKDASDPTSGKLFDTSIINAGSTAQISTAKLSPGDYPFHCSLHPYMKGSIIIMPSSLSNSSSVGLMSSVHENVSSSIQFVKLLVNDSVQSLKSGDTKGAILHLNLANQELRALGNMSSSIQLIKLLVNDTIQSLGIGDTKAAILHLGLVNQQLVMPGMNTSNTVAANAATRSNQTNVNLSNNVNASITKNQTTGTALPRSSNLTNASPSSNNTMKQTMATNQSS